MTHNRLIKDYLPTIPDKYIDSSTKKLVDMWGNEYRFWWKGVEERAVIYSLGENGTDETSDGNNNFGDDVNNL